MLLFRITLLAVFIYLYQFPIAKFQSGEYKENVPIFILGITAVSMFPLYFIWTLLGVLWIRISDDDRNISFHYLYKTISVSGDDIAGYYKTTLKTKVKEYDGLIIKLNSGKVLEVTEYNLSRIDAVREFLSLHKVPLWGNKKSWFPFTRKV